MARTNNYSKSDSGKGSMCKPTDVNTKYQFETLFKKSEF